MNSLFKILAEQVMASWALLIIIGSTALVIIIVAGIITIVRNTKSRSALKNSVKNAFTNKENIERTLEDNPLLYKKGDNYFYGDYIVSSVFIAANKCILKNYFYYKYGSKIRRSCVYIRIMDDGTMEQGKYLSVAACQSVGIL